MMIVLYIRQTQMRENIQQEISKTIETRGLELKQAQDETTKLEIRLRQGQT